MDFLKRIRWGSSKDEVQSLFGLPGDPHPTMDALGFPLEFSGLSGGAVCYFRRALIGSKLVLMFFEARPPDAVSQSAYRTIKEKLVALFGQPNKAVQCHPNDPPEFRQSEMLIWINRDSVLTLSLRLLKDGVPKDSTPIGVGFGDAKHDPISKALL